MTVARSIDSYIASVSVVGRHRCWKLPLIPLSNGYVNISIPGKKLKAHRAIYQHLVKRIPRGKQLDHLCRNRWCVHPNHLVPVTNKTNSLRGQSPAAQNARKTRCKRGHIFSRKRNGHRICIPCQRQHVRNHRRRNR